MHTETSRRGCIGEMLVRATLAGAIAACLPTSAAAAQSTSAADVNIAFDIRAGDLAGALDQFSTQSGIQLSYQPSVVEGKRVASLAGRLTWRDALNRLLQGSGLEYRQVNDRTVAIVRVERKSTPGAKGAAAVPTTKPTARDEAQTKDIDKITVTGTRIRGGSTPSPTITIGAENIREEGFSNLGDVIRSVPQNFRGGQNPGALPNTVAASGHANQDLTGGSSLNLRGLGPDATLTLLDGRRMAYGGYAQGVDISTIPVEAVDRIEIVADGASAIYGSDAVGGVGNVVLKRDFEGVTLSTRYGAATEGGLGTSEYAATAGTTWSTGGLIGTYKYTSVDPIYARQRSYSDHLPDPTMIYPGSDQRSALLSAYQQIGDMVELRIDAIRNIRDRRYNFFSSGSIFYANTETTTTLLSPSVEFLLPSDWSMSASATFGKDVHEHVQHQQKLATGVVVLQADDCFCNESRVYEIGAEGPLFALGGGDARLAVGAGYRTNDYLHHRRAVNIVAVKGDDASRFAYAELNLPLMSPESGRARGARLEATAAMRVEDYDTVGRVSTPKLGLIFGPSPDVTLKASWGRSFKLPTLRDRYRVRYGSLDYPSYYGGTDDPSGSTVLAIDGGNRDLAPERARTWAASVAFHPMSLSSLDVELTWFNIDYTDRVVAPIPNWWEALSNPIYAQFVSYAPSEAEKAALIANSDVFDNYTGVPFDPAKVYAIIYFQPVNASHQRIKGLDLTGSYRLNLLGGELTLRGAVSWLDSSQQISVAEGAYDLAGTLGYPPKLNGRLGAVWNSGAFSASAFANYTGGVTNLLDGRKGASFTTFDATLRYGITTDAERQRGWEFALSLQNMLDRSPPLYAPPPASASSLAPYDSANYSPVGRFVSASVSRHW